MSKISLKHIYKKYDNSPKTAVSDFNLEIEDKEFIVFVGPSGCGKSTTLRMIAGLEEITEGDLFINGVRMNDVAPKDRGIAMVFQSYALYPHLSVYENIGFGLKIRGVNKKKRDQDIRETAELLGLTQFLDRKPKELSGGQRQRIALGRAIVKKSEIFLMDEPLSNLDAKLRSQMRKELVELQRELGSTCIYVTHDQTEAMTMATRIVCMKDGEIQQVGSPEELYSNPSNMFVAGFLGAPPMNFINGKIENGKLISNSNMYLADLPRLANMEIVAGFRPESIQITEKENGQPMSINLVEVLGADYYIHGNINGQKIIVRTEADTSIKESETIYIKITSKDILLFDPKTEERIYWEDNNEK